MLFTVTARDPQGARRTFERAAASRRELAAALRAERWLVLDMKEQTSANREFPPAWHPAWLKPVTSFDVEIGLRELSSMLRSGITLLEGLRAVADQASSPRAKRMWLRVSGRVLEGDSFTAALSAQPRRFGEIVVRLSEVGERAGELEHTVGRAADQLEARRGLRATVFNALMYPFVAVLAAAGVSAYLVLAVIPKIAEFLESGGTELPAITQTLMDLSSWVSANGPIVLLWLAAALAAWFAARLHEGGRELEDVLLLHVPVTGRILRLSGTTLFARSMQIMTESGVTLLDALATGARLMSNRRLRRRVRDAHDGVLRGRSLADALSPASEFTPMLRRMVAVGEIGGSLPETFRETAHLHEMMLAIAVKRFGMLIEPVMIVATGAVVGFVYIAFFSAIFTIAGAS